MSWNRKRFFACSVVDDTVRANADFQYKSGLSPKIVRTAESGCCEWCDKLAGIYNYEDVRDTGNDVFRRHKNCRCLVELDVGNGKRQNAHSKKWYEVSEEELEKRKNFKGVDTSGVRKVVEKPRKNGTIKEKKSTFLQERLVYKYDGKVQFIPEGAEFNNRKVIAGFGSKTELRKAGQLSKKYGKPKEKWSKVAGKIESDKYIFDVHWYEHSGIQYDAKVKTRKEKK